MFKKLKSWWNELHDVRPFVTAFVDEFNSNRGRFRVYCSEKDKQSILVFDKYCEVFYPVWCRSDTKICKGLEDGCYSLDFIKKVLSSTNYTIENVEWTTFLTHREQTYLYKYCYEVWWDKHQKGVDEKMKAKKQAFNVKLLNRYSN